MVRVKICGITNIEDAKVAVDAGANALGFVFAESPRKVEARTVSNIVSMLPPLVAAVGVFANQEVDEILSVMESTDLHFAQIHGDISNHGFGRAEYPFGIIRALSVRSDMDIEDLKGDHWLEIAEAVLLDTHVEGLMGGTGQTFDWDLAVRAKSLGKPVILAGGLTPANVRDAVSKVCPYAVDVSSGVEAVPGRKDHDKVREFVNNATR